MKGQRDTHEKVLQEAQEQVLGTRRHKPLSIEEVVVKVV
jgi:hypothetical protein